MCEEEQELREQKRRRPISIARSRNNDESWKRIVVPDKILIKKVHMFTLVKNTEREARDAVKQKQDDDEEDSENEDTGWLCDGPTKLRGDCKSGQTDFGEHEGTQFWTSSNKDSDFDLCELCLKWCIHC